MKSKNSSEKILNDIKSKGFKFIELDSVIETNHIVERSGETFKRFLFSFNDQKGKELCLRPDLTIASCIRYLSRKTTDTEKVYYQGYFGLLLSPLESYFRFPIAKKCRVVFRSTLKR